MATTTKIATHRTALNSGDPGALAAAASSTKLGSTSAKIKVTFTGLADVAAQDITTAAAKAAATISGITLATGENLPAIGQIVTLRTTAGTLATHGSHIVTDAGGTALVPQADSSGVALLSDDGATITFQAGVTAFVLTYYPAPAVALNSEFALAAP